MHRIYGTTQEKAPDPFIVNSSNLKLKNLIQSRLNGPAQRMSSIRPTDPAQLMSSIRPTGPAQRMSSIRPTGPVQRMSSVQWVIPVQRAMPLKPAHFKFLKTNPSMAQTLIIQFGLTIIK